MAIFINNKSHLLSLSGIIAVSIIFVAVYIIMHADNGSVFLVAMKLAPGPDLRWYSLITYMFVHNNLTHLISNTVMMWISFCIFDRSNRVLFVPIFILGGFVGGLAFVFYDVDGISLIGASNGIAATIAATLFLPNGGKYNRYGFRLLAGGLLLFALLGNVSHKPVFMGHLGGAIAGVIISGVVYVYIRYCLRQRLSDDHSIPKDIELKLRNSGYDSLSEEERQKIAIK